MANTKTFYQIHDPARESGKALTMSREVMESGGLELFYDDSDIELIKADLHPDIRVLEVVLALH